METVVYGNGIVTNSKLRELIGERKHLVVADTALIELYPDLLEGLNVHKAPSGEEVKSIGSYAEMVSSCNINYLTRSGVIVAIGGGAVMDAAGFLASTYMRGVSLIKIPTTLIAMCDAGIGGKTALNSLSAKNEIGTFYHAETVVVDVDFLKTLPREEMRSGMGEMMKYAVGFSPSALDVLKTFDYEDIRTILPLVKDAILIKQSIVEEDFTDRGSRLTLNFGHTIGHAVEFASDFTISHGEAVAIGVYFMAQWANREECISDDEMDLVTYCYEHLGLPMQLPGDLNRNAVFSHVLSDKKMVGGEIRLVKLEAMGKLRVEKTSLDVFYEEVFRGAKKRYTYEEQWLLGLRRKKKFAVRGASDAATADAATLNLSSLYQDETRYAVIDLPSSKSYAHRYLILAAFATSPTVIESFDMSEDLYNTINALREMSGAKFEFKEDVLLVIPKAAQAEDKDAERQSPSIKKRIEVDCGSSASTARFLIPFSGIGREGLTYFYGSASLESRPMNSMINILKAQGILSGPVHTRSLPFAVTDRLKPGVFKLPGDVTSQFLSGLLMATPLMKGKSRIMVSGTQVSMPYVDITLDVMKKMGVTVEVNKPYSVYTISPSKYAVKGNIVVEKDYSQAAFFLVAELLRQIRGANLKQVLLPGLLRDSLQGDRAILDMLGVTIGKNGEMKRVSQPQKHVDLTHFPDLFPIMTVFFALNGNGGMISGADRVSYKESDRFEAMKLEITRLGGRVARENGKLRIYPVTLQGKTVSVHDDHRIAMALSVLGLFVPGVRIDSTDCIKKSYPAFLEDLKKLRE